MCEIVRMSVNERVLCRNKYMCMEKQNTKKTKAEKAAKEVKDVVVKHVEDKQTELVEAAKTETVWYKKIGFYVAASIGAVVVQFLNSFGSETFQTIVDTISQIISK